MIRACLLAALVFVGAAGCRKTHLGKDTGRAYRAAFAAQRDAEPERKPRFGAGDAKATMAARRGEKKASSSSSTTTTSSSSIMAPPTDSGWSGAQGPITLEAK